MTSTVAIAIPSPYVTPEKYSEMTGESVKSIRRKVSAGEIPAKPRQSPQERLLINVALITKQALEY